MKPFRDILKWLKKLFAYESGRNWKVITLCMLTATTFWFFNALNKPYSTVIDYPLKFEYDTEGLVTVNELPNKLRVNISGGGWSLLKQSLGINRKTLIVPLDRPTQRNFIVGEELNPIIHDQLDPLQANYVVTDTLFVHIEKLAKRTLPVKVNKTSISLREGYRIVSPVRFRPAIVTFTGPVSIIKNLPDTVLIDIPEKEIDEQDYIEAVNLPRLPGDELLTPSTTKVEVSFETDRFTKLTRIVPLRQLNFPADSSIYLADTLGILSFVIQQEFLDQLDTARFDVLADFGMFNETDSTIKLEITRAPNFILDLKVEPSAVKVTYAKKK
ncbi:hypothetical protein [Xanthovirga aplysinae]|uniref:hypothetical protein n=1 Tax=Xanthovirga aplysinae TaxID=2529853 RepID=UPI0012BD6997|nr:hypothetical protein [Xanthovirga aplysinae]MTI33360.1 hypothetical protein [Xanthovirga aplysinae]